MVVEGWAGLEGLEVSEGGEEIEGKDEGGGLFGDNNTCEGIERAYGVE